jgi:hypothetical protein
MFSSLLKLIAERKTLLFSFFFRKEKRQGNKEERKEQRCSCSGGEVGDGVSLEEAKGRLFP